MAINHLRSFGCCLLALGVSVAMACSGAAKNEQPEDDDDTSTSGAGGEGGSGGAGGGMGGAPSACAIDCATVQTPQCQIAVCNEATAQCEIQPAAQGAACDDAQFCTVNDYCEGGLCKGGSQNTCGLPPDPCQTVTCDETTDSCSGAPANDGTPCALVDTNLCVINPKCQNGICSGTMKDCFFAPGGECNTLTCNPMTGDCDPTPNPAKNGQPCSSGGDLCAVGKTCDNGNCAGGTPKDCSQFTINCTNGVCDPATGQCKGEPIPQGQMCLQGTDDCNVGICDNNGMCVPMPANEGGVCNDGNSCTVGETCAAGVCQGGMMGQYVPYFTETFASNAAGWVLGPEWQIGAAMASNCPSGNDPAMDHTPSQDNGVAGVVIGGCASTSLHPFQYIESPPVDVSAAPGAVYLEFWRWLTSDYTPFMQNSIDVWNGSAWINVWLTGPSPGVTDTQWEHVSYDITAHKNAALKVRFGMTVTSGGVFTIGSWNIDDLAIANMVCNP